MRKSAVLALGLSALLLAGACERGGGQRRAERGGGGNGEACPNELPFHAARLPAGYARKLETGPGGEAKAPRNARAFHYRHNEEEDRVITVYRGARAIKMPDEVRGVKLFEDQNGRIGAVDGGHVLEFRLGEGRCELYQVHMPAVGEEREVRRLARGLTEGEPTPRPRRSPGESPRAPRSPAASPAASPE